MTANDLTDFAERVKVALARANREPRWETDKAERYMADVRSRRHQFEQIASRLGDAVVLPRLEIVSSQFPTAGAVQADRGGTYLCWFGFSERFPASAKIEFSFEHDVRFENLVVAYEMYMMPAFIKFNGHDRLTVPLAAIEDGQVANWVEQRLLDFVDAYLQIDRGTADFEEDMATDPVCGMRIGRSSAVASESYYGHPYFFCSDECQEAFSANSEKYVDVKTL